MLLPVTVGTLTLSQEKLNNTAQGQAGWSPDRGVGDGLEAGKVVKSLYIDLRYWKCIC